MYQAGFQTFFEKLQNAMHRTQKYYQTVDEAGKVAALVAAFFSVPLVKHSIYPFRK